MGHAVNGTAANSTVKSKRSTAPDVVQAIEAALDGHILASKRDVAASITAALQNYLEYAVPESGHLKRGSASDDLQGLLRELESLGFSSSGNNTGKRSLTSPPPVE